jgi:hypothetical protein
MRAVERAALFLLLALPAGGAMAVPIDVPFVITGPSLPPPPPGTCTISILPPATQIPANTPLGAKVATILSNCSTLTFAAPNFDDGGLFALSGVNVIINPAGPGVSQLANTTQYGTITASPP